jgi:hypothetical protein
LISALVIHEDVNDVMQTSYTHEWRTSQFSNAATEKNRDPPKKDAGGAAEWGEE